MNPEEYERMYALEDWYWWFVARREAAIRFLLDYAPKQTGLDILDAGCGTGAMLDRLSAIQDATVVGLDISTQALGFTHGRGHHWLLGGDLSDLPLQPSSFDAVTALDVIEHLEDDAKAVRHLAQCLRVGGVLVASVPAFSFLWSPHDEALHHHRRYVRGEFRRLLQGAGLEVVKSTYLLTALFPIAAALRVGQRLLFRKRDEPPRTNLVHVSPLINRCLTGIQGLELGLARRCSLPFGLSILAVARRPEQPA